MKQLLISFKSRNELYSFARLLKANNIIFSIINTPKSIGSSCILSIKTEHKNLNFISNLLSQFNPKSFLGVYSFISSPNGNQIFRLL